MKPRAGGVRETYVGTMEIAATVVRRGMVRFPKGRENRY